VTEYEIKNKTAGQPHEKETGTTEMGPSTNCAIAIAIVSVCSPMTSRAYFFLDKVKPAPGSSRSNCKILRLATAGSFIGQPATTSFLFLSRRPTSAGTRKCVQFFANEFQLKVEMTNLCGSAKTNRLSFRSVRTTPLLWQ
jgi:hypothetical protein